MSTRSRIAILNPDNSIRTIYCHFDGYLEHNGQVLLSHYSDPAKVTALIDLGDISGLREEIGEKHNFDKFYEHPTWVKAYGRDRGEAQTEARSYPSLQAFPHDSFEEFFYLFTGEGWKWFPGSRIDKLAPLTQEAIDGDDSDDE